jgi:hypothetical protein
MKQYKITFFNNDPVYRNNHKGIIATSYREFESSIELKKWAVSVMRECGYSRYSYIKISVTDFLNNTPFIGG